MNGNRQITCLRAAAFAVVGGFLLLAAGPSLAAGDTKAPNSPGFSFQGPFGTFDRGELQRGFQVYQEVCSSCHAIKYLAFRNLLRIGFSEEQVKAIAAQYEVTDGPDAEGEMFQRPARLSDHVPSPFANDNAARFANNGALPPDLSLIVKARTGGENYLYSLLTGYEDPSSDVELGEGMSYNAYFPGHQIAMPPPLFEDGVEYADGKAASTNQMARDVTTFLTWVAEPDLETRKGMGIKVMIFLILLTALLYMVKRKVWRDVH
jgi:ubiquinol-cytochrome c reductase cytochrome c1 subunit